MAIISRHPDGGLTFAGWLTAVREADNPVAASNYALQALILGAPQALVARRMLEGAVRRVDRLIPREVAA